MTNKWLQQPLYRVWLNMRQRCNNSNVDCYKYYGGRGIKICEEWSYRSKGYKNFYEWAINNGYKKGLTLDRIDVNGNYEPSNCRWVSRYIQNINKRNTCYVIYDGKKISLKELSKMLGINYFTLHYRLKNHSVEESCQKERYSIKKVASSGERYITISRNKKHIYYVVRIKGKHIGTYKSMEEAIDARNKALASYV